MNIINNYQIKFYSPNKANNKCISPNLTSNPLSDSVSFSGRNYVSVPKVQKTIKAIFEKFGNDIETRLNDCRRLELFTWCSKIPTTGKTVEEVSNAFITSKDGKNVLWIHSCEFRDEGVGTTFRTINIKETHKEPLGRKVIADREADNKDLKKIQEILDEVMAKDKL